jgi:hypothetical protein
VFFIIAELLLLGAMSTASDGVKITVCVYRITVLTVAVLVVYNSLLMVAALSARVTFQSGKYSDIVC